MHSQPALRALRPAPGSVYGARGGAGRAAWTPGARAAVEDDAGGDADAGFDRLREGFRASGGLLAADDLAGRVRPSHGQGVGLVARWIVERSVVSVDSLGSYWIPAFQFCPSNWTPHPALAAVLAELPRADNGWSLAHWFSDANAALGGRRPADLLASVPHEVQQAARTTRFALRG